MVYLSQYDLLVVVFSLFLDVVSGCVMPDVTGQQLQWHLKEENISTSKHTFFVVSSKKSFSSHVHSYIKEKSSLEIVEVSLQAGQMKGLKRRRVNRFS